MPTSTKAPEQRPKKVFKKTKDAHARLRADLLNGFYPPGWLNRELVAQSMGLNTMTLKSVFAALAAEGLLEEKKQKRGRATYYVLESPPAPAGLLAEARASVALDGDTQSYGEEAPAAVQSTGKVAAGEAAAATLRADLAAGKYPVGTLFPTQPDLAAALGTNQQAIWLAVSALKREGLLEGGSGHRTKVIALPKPTPEESAVQMAQSFSEEGTPKTLAERKQVTVRQYIIDCIADGTYTPGSLMPSLQLMANTTGAQYQTIRYVYERLEKQGFLTKDPDGNWIVAAASGHTPKPGVVPVEQYPPPPPDDDEPGDLISASEVLPIIKVLSDENRQLRAAQETARTAAERLSGYEQEIKRLRGQVAEERGNANRLDAENAELRGKLHRNGNGNRKVIHTFGPDFKNGVGWSDAEAARIKGLMAAPKGAKAQ